jgi:mevalonate pyrophosphate decarboxylase
MAAVYVSNLVINSGADFSQTFSLESVDNNSALNLTDYTVSAQMRKYSGSSTATIFTPYIIPPATLGKITISLTSEQTTNLKPGRYVYDVVITKNSIKTRVIEGMVLVREGVTR